MNCCYEYDSKFFSRNDMYLFIYPKENKYKVYEDDECKKEISINDFINRKSCIHNPNKLHLVIKD